MIISVDTETTGTDFWHGCRAFLVQICDGTHNYAWQGKVNPYNRMEVIWDDKDLDDIQAFLDKATVIIFHNAKFDMRALHFLNIEVDHLWDKVEDTVIASHVLCSGESHALKYLAFKYLDYYNEEEKLLEDAVKAARTDNPDYDLARPGHPSFPGIGANKKNIRWWKMDYWLCIDECLKYGMADVEMTYLLWTCFLEAMHKHNLMEQYNTRKALLPIAYDMEVVGLNMYADEVRKEILALKKEREDIRKKIQSDLKITWHFDLTQDKNKSMFLYKILKLPVLEYTEKSKQPSIAKGVIERLVAQFPDNESLQDFQRFNVTGTQIGYLNSYLKWVCDDGRLRPNIWITGTRETRQAISDPNTQNIDKRLRHIIGPPPGYVWLDYDLVNIELRVWTYQVGNKELIQVFESGGSVHLLVASIIHPVIWARYPGDIFKKEFEDTHYQWVKNGNFAIIYGATEKKADRTYKVDGAYSLIARRFPEVPPYTAKVINEVWYNLENNDAPYITCIGGYRLDVPTDDIFKACNYKIQGSAGYFITEAMINVIKNPYYRDYNCKIVNQVHDSIILEVPIDYPKELETSMKESIEAAGLKYIPTCEASYKVKYNEQDLPF